ncbi:MAG TPA: polysaccharide deacetylase family protein, partial [Puia sp.]
MFYLVKTPWWLRKLYGDLTWRMPASSPDSSAATPPASSGAISRDKVLYLTFDDGPHPEVTPFVLEQLKKYNARATFFCIGKNVKEHPETYRQVLMEGHRVGNHTENHL